MTTHELLTDYRRLRDAGASPLQRREAYNRWFKQSVREGTPPDALSKYSPDEAERFWSRTVPGPEGHVYWTGGLMFRRNGGLVVKPQRWAWRHKHGDLSPYVEIETTCGEQHCVNVAHLQIRPRLTRRIHFPDERAFNTLRVLALQRGITPSANDWDRAKPGISAAAMMMRFGNWGTFVRRAGLVPREVRVTATRELCEEAILALTERLGRRPTATDWLREREWLRANKYPTSDNTITKRIGPTFAQAVTKVLSQAQRAA